MNIEIISRAIILKDNKLLLCKSTKHGNYYLPGGHVEFGESAEAALKREMIEESASEINNLHFVGCFENKWGEPAHHEYNMIYTADITDTSVVSREDHIAFEWIEVSNLRDLLFYPAEFLVAINEWCENQENIYLSTIK